MSLLATASRALLVLVLSCTLCVPAQAQTKPQGIPSYAALLRTINPQLAAWQSVVYARTLLDLGRRWKIDPALLTALVTIESGWNPSAVSRHGALGLGQLMPFTAANLGVNPRSGVENLRGTSTYLHGLLQEFRKARDPMRSALAGYNVGPLNVKRAGGVPGAAAHYVTMVLHEYKHVQERAIVIARVVRPRASARAVAESSLVDRDAAYWGAP